MRTITRWTDEAYTLPTVSFAKAICDKLQLEDLLDGLAVGSRVGHNQQPGLQVLLPKPRFKHTALVLNCTGQGTKGHH